MEQKPKVAEPVPEPVVTACVGKKVSELDDFDYSMPKRSNISSVRPGGFQVRLCLFLLTFSVILAFSINVSDLY